MPITNERGNFEHWNEDVELIKNCNNIKKGSIRTVHIDKCLDPWPTILLSNLKGKTKESYTFSEVKECLSHASTNLIQLTCTDNRTVLIRLKSSDLKYKWLNYLKNYLYRDENVYEEPESRERAVTVNQQYRGQQQRTWRGNNNVQSLYNPDVTTLHKPTPVSRVLDSMQDIYEDVPGPEPAHSLRSDDYMTPTVQRPRYGNEQESFNQAVINLSINVNSSSKPIPPLRYTSLPCRTRDGEESGGGDYMHLAPNNAGLLTELKSVVNRKNVTKTSKPEFPARPSRGEQTYSPSDAASFYNENVVPFSYDEASVLTGAANATHRNRPEIERKNNLTADEQESSSSSSSDDEPEQSLYMNIPPGPYVANTRPCTLKCEMKEESITCQVERSLLQTLVITTTSDGPCICNVPENLQRRFYHGDLIVNINEQTIPNAEFAHIIINTSTSNMVKVTVKRLFKGYLIELDRQTIGDSLGFSLKNGPEIETVTPGTVFARKASCAMRNRMTITHINDQYIPLNSDKRHVSTRLRKAGFKFFIILQPSAFVTELTR